MKSRSLDGQIDLLINSSRLATDLAYIASDSARCPRGRTLPSRRRYPEKRKTTCPSYISRLDTRRVSDIHEKFAHRRAGYRVHQPVVREDASVARPATTHFRGSSVSSIGRFVANRNVSSESSERSREAITARLMRFEPHCDDSLL